jgi:hypothetical protein
LTPGLTIVAVNMRAYKTDLLKDAIKANKDGSAPIDLLVREGDALRHVRIDYRDGLRYPRLERIAGTPDRLTDILRKR